MTPERWRQVDDLLQTALSRDARDRRSFLSQACAGDEALRAEVESLLAALEHAGDFLSEPAMDLAAESIAAQAQDLTGSLIAHYRIISPLGAGGMGGVYLAEDTILGRRVGLKLLPSYFSRDPKRVARFEQEARLAATLTHPNICVIHEIGRTDEGQLFIAMEYVQGVTLRQRMRDTVLDVDAILDIARQVATALSKAHAAGIVHRDIKPDNIMVSRDGYVKVLDFGIAKLFDGSVDAASALSQSVTTHPGMILGTTAYMSPEQVRGLDVDARSDVWSFGVVLYEMLCGRPPFAGATPSDTIAAILEREPAAVGEHGRTPARMQTIVRKTLQKDRNDRYPTASELLSDISALTVDWRPTGAGFAGKRAVSRLRHVSQRVWFAAAAVILVFAGLIAAASYPRSQTLNSLAVLPFVHVGDNPNAEFLADGLTDSLINGLSQLPNVKVIARHSVFRYKVRDAQAAGPDPHTVGRELSVQAVLIGRIVERGDNVAVSVELVDTNDAHQIWGAQYTRKVADVLAVQERIASDISQELRVKLTGEERKVLARRETANVQALEAYARGRSHLDRRTQEDLLRAKTFYEQAIVLDRNYALAYAGLSDVYGNLSVRGYISPAEGQKKLTEAARIAVQLDENLAEAHVAMAVSHLGVPYDFPDADRELKRAIELNPNLALAHFYFGLSLMRQGRLDEALPRLVRARELDPLSAIIARQFSLYYYLKRDYLPGLQTIRQANLNGPAFTTSNEIGIYVQRGLYDEALAGLEMAKRERRDDPVLDYSTGLVFAAQGRRQEVMDIVRGFERRSGAENSLAHWIARLYSALNDAEPALAWLERGLAAGSLAAFYKDEPVWDNLRTDPRFDDLLRRMGIPRATREGI